MRRHGLIGDHVVKTNEAPARAADDTAVAPAGVPVAHDAPPRIRHTAILRTIARNSLPHLIEATIVPAVLFYACLLTWGLMVAFIAAATWSYGAIIWRIVTHRPISSILFLATGALTLRTIIAIASGSAFIYFLQPVMGTIVMAGVFLGSLLFGQPLVGRLARDFWPLSPEVAAHPAVLRLFRSLTILWACVNLALAGVTFVLLLTLPVEGFVPAKTLSGYIITGTGVLVTVSWSITTARRNGLEWAATMLVPERAFS